MNEIIYFFAETADLAQIQALLTQCNLPTEGIDSVLQHCLIARCGPALAGTVALEPYGKFALLRSLAVHPAHRLQGLGGRLCAKIINYARLQHIERLYLLTMAAETFFAARGFQRMERTAVPPQVQVSAQFTQICPSSAVCMTRLIADQVIHASPELLRLRADVPGARMWAVALEKTMLTYFEVAPHSRFETHSHESEQITMVLSGELYFRVGETEHCVRAREVIAIPSSIPHAVWTESLPVNAIDAWSPVMKNYK